MLCRSRTEQAHRAHATDKRPQDYTKGLQCTNILSGCYPGYLQATNYNEAATSCYCTYGISYLDCYYSQVATGTCASYYFGTAGTS